MLVRIDGRAGAVAGRETVFLLDALLERQHQQHGADDERNNDNSCNQVAPLSLVVVVPMRLIHDVYG